jgi:hypothetical protein
MSSGTLPDESGVNATFSRSTTATIVQLGVESTCSANQPRIGERGLLLERFRKQEATNPDATTTETTTISAVGTVYSWMEGSGSVAISAGTASTTGLPCTVSAGNPCTFTIVSGGTVVRTVTGSPSFFSLESSAGGSYATSRYHTGNAVRNLDSLSGYTSLGPTNQWCFDATVGLEGAYTRVDTQFFGLFSVHNGGNGTGMNEARAYLKGVAPMKMYFEVYDATSTIRSTSYDVSALVADSDHRWTLCANVGAGTAAMYLDAQLLSTVSVGGAGTGRWTAFPPQFNVGRIYNGHELDGYFHNFAFCPGASGPWNCDAANGGVRPQVRIAAVGDSWTGRTDVGYPWALRTTLGSGYYVAVEGTSGDTTTQILTRWNSGIRRGGYRYVSLLGGVNDLNAGTSAATIYANLKATCDAAIADGSRVILMTVSGFNGWPGWSSAKDAQRLALNQSILSYCTTNPAAKCIDIATVFTDPSGALYPLYDVGDHLHPSVAARDYIVTQVSAAIAGP